MQLTKSLLIGGVAALALAGTAALAAGSGTPVHEITVRLPGGGIERIEYAGDVAPQVVVSPAPFGAMWPAPIAFWQDPGFAALDRISADMDRRMDTMLRNARAMALVPFAGGQGLNEAALRSLPPGASSWSWSASYSGHNVCTRMFSVTEPAGGGKPQVVSRQSGYCGGSSGGGAAVESPAPADQNLHTISVKVPAHTTRIHPTTL